MNIVIVGSSITAWWENGPASIYRPLVHGLAMRGHDVLFLERSMPWYAAHRDLPQPPDRRVRLYSDSSELEDEYASEIGGADLVVIGSLVPDGIAAIDAVQRLAIGCTAFYDLDPPATFGMLRRDRSEFVDRRQIPAFDLYLSVTGGPMLERFERMFGARRARPLFGAVDADAYRPSSSEVRDYDLGYLGACSPARQATLDALFIQPARAWPAGRFVTAGAQCAESIAFPANVKRLRPLAPREQAAFYNRSRFVLNVTDHDMVAAGYSPGVRLFEAAACGTPIISDLWAGLGALFEPGREILLANSAGETLSYLEDLSEAERLQIGRRGRERVLASHTSTHRAIELERYVAEASDRPHQSLQQVPVARFAKAVVR